MDPARDQPGSTLTTSGPNRAHVTSVRFVSQNILHGIACGPDSDACALPARIALFMDQLAQAGCPEMVSIQEASDGIVALLTEEIQECGYELVWDNDPGLDREVVLSTLRVIDSQRWVLADRFRSAYLVRAASPIGVVNFLTTHLASSENRPCNTALCPPPCDPDERLRSCQVRQLLEITQDVASPKSITVLGGDLNATVDESPIRLLTDNGFVDSHLASGLSECMSSGQECTAGRDAESLKDMTDPASQQKVRIDYLFYSAADRDCSPGPDTGLFNAEPAVGELAFPSDHTGVALTLQCLTTQSDIAAAVDSDLAELPDPDPGATPEGLPANDATRAAISAAFELFLDGSISDVGLRAAQVEDSPGVQQAVIKTFSQVGQVGAEARGRVESVRLTSSVTAEVTYSILVANQVAMTGRIGEAILVDQQWFVSKTTFCDLVAIGGQAEGLDVCR